MTLLSRGLSQKRESDLTASSKLKPAWKRRRIKHETSDLNELWADVPRLHFGEFTGAPHFVVLMVVLDRPGGVHSPRRLTV